VGAALWCTDADLVRVEDRRDPGDLYDEEEPYDPNRDQ
jgi:hypothetical protein